MEFYHCSIKRIFSLLFFAGIVTLLYSCDQNLDISNFDEEAWKGDRLACQNSRTKLEEDLLSSKDELKGLTQQEIKVLLGKPEKQELYRRGQKFYIYYLKPAPQCEVEGADKDQRLLYIRFSALNQVNEIFIKNS